MELTLKSSSGRKVKIIPADMRKENKNCRYLLYNDCFGSFEVSNFSFEVKHKLIYDKQVLSSKVPFKAGRRHSPDV